MSLALAIARNSSDHEILIVLNGLFPDSIEPIRAAFDGLIPQENIKVWSALGPVNSADPANTWRRHTAECLREAFIDSLKPDIVHISSMFEGFGDNAVHSIGKFSSSVCTAATFYDLIPLIQSEVYLTPHPTFEALYREKLDYLRKTNLLLAISESSKKEAIDYLDVSPGQVVNISAAGDSHFEVKHFSKSEKEQIQRAFGIKRPFLMYSGATDDRKNHLRLIQAFARLDREIRDQHQLLFAGKLPNEHRKKFQEYAKICGLDPSSLIITGQITDLQMVNLYNLCHLFVFPSWHEGFGLPALEAMLCGAPVIASNTTSLPEVLGRDDGLFDPFDTDSMAGKITEVLTNESLRKDIAKHGLERSKKFSWDESAKRALKAFEELHSRRKAPAQEAIYDDNTNDYVSMVVQKIADATDVAPDDDQLSKIAEAIDKNHPKNSYKQLFVDISQLVTVDSKTGIQRVVRSILNELIIKPPIGYKVEPVYATPHELGYRYARQFMAKFLGSDDKHLSDSTINFRNGDIFLGLDLQHHVVLRQESLYAEMRHTGVAVHFVLYDLLPVLLPRVFPDFMPALHAQWLSALAKVDGLICISKAVADEMAKWLAVFGPKRARPLKLGWFHLGADVAGSVPSKGLPPDAYTTLAAFSARPTFLMVGTIEPRKGQMQTLKAFDLLWKSGEKVNLVMVGKSGWNVDLLSEMLRIHPERNKRLFWLEGVSDEFLEKVYANSSCLIAASEGEGFGLPLIEAAQNRLPIIARDIPVFREVAGSHAAYFSGLEPEALADTVMNWLAKDREGGTPQSTHMPWLTWTQSTHDLLGVFLGGNWYQHWKPDGIKRYWGSDNRMLTQVGIVSGQSICTTNQAGYLLFGPYIYLDAGAYRITIKGSLNKTGLSGAHFDAAAEKGSRVFAQKKLNSPDANGQLLTLPITLETACDDLEIRVWVSEKCDLKISLIEIEPVIQEAPSLPKKSISVESVNYSDVGSVNPKSGLQPDAEDKGKHNSIAVARKDAVADSKELGTTSTHNILQSKQVAPLSGSKGSKPIQIATGTRISNNLEETLSNSFRTEKSSLTAERNAAEPSVSLNAFLPNSPKHSNTSRNKAKSARKKKR
ncbi:glycosyltransferase family 1 protein [Variovorax sp. PCZ-1]|uniref:glycosyltransferase family 4 protein n=1 Tax=Variovorax sp. PCZ-1 TaxID=2835533 RepID=UPI001BCD9272|nr:glycosyltransferase family 1 protein [Variovorax sp. PCZ-1]MBS7807675.1 glycosyltransferase family 4 protein [Variovorax sp. PCZ-1]